MAVNRLYEHPLFSEDAVSSLSPDDRVARSYKRARIILQTHDLTVDDVLEIGPKFWELHLDPIIPRDLSAFTILTAHINLAVGTIARYLKDRPDLQPLVSSLLRLDTVGLYMLSERGHGLDVFNLETIATRTDSGFVLNTPREEAMKLMSATTPAFGVRKIAVVMARLVIEGIDRGHRWFIVPICDERRMHPGVVSIRLPVRTGTCPLDFSLTSFHHVHLPHSALLGPLDISPNPSPSREAWWSEVWRLTHGSMAVAAPFVQALKYSTYIGGTYSSHRQILDKGFSPVPLITIPTQQWPIIQGIAIASVLEAWYRRCAASVTSREFTHEVLHGISITVKATVFRYFQQCSDTIAERCGAQGTFEWNEMSRMACDGKGGVIAEGDITTLCIRLFSLVVQGHVVLPLPASSDSLLARHAHAILEENKSLLQSFPDDHRGSDFAYRILPKAENAIIVFGAAMAFSAARMEGVSLDFLDVFELCAIDRDPSWYTVHAGLIEDERFQRKARASQRVLADIKDHLEALGVAKYVLAPIVSEDRLKAAIQRLPTYGGDATIAAQSQSSGFSVEQLNTPLHLAKL